MVVGAEIYNPELEVYVIKNIIKYYSLPNLLKKFTYIPLSIIETLWGVIKFKPNLLITTGGVFYNGLSILIIGKIFKIPTIIRTAEDHFNYYKFSENYFEKIYYYFLRNKLSRLILRQSDYVLTVGEDSKTYFIKNGVKKEKIFAIPGPINFQKFKKNNDINKINKIKLNNLIPLNKKIILFVGALTKIKGADEIPLLIQQVNKKSQNYHFLIIGAQDKNKKIINQIANFTNVTILSTVDNEKLSIFYSMSEIVVFLTKVGVGYGLVTLEALLMNKPVLVLDSGLDLSNFHRKNCCKDVYEMSIRIINEDYSILDIPNSFEFENIKKKHLELINYAIKKSNF
jgi:glycosyltransferase involved in cell wall biosynthesis